MDVRALHLRDEHYGDQWTAEVENHWLYDDFVADPRWRDGWISFDSVLHNPDDDRVYCGITCFNENGIFRAWDRREDAFVDLGYSRIAKRFDAKFHRALERASDGSVYAAVALLHCGDKYMEAPGSPIIRLEPDTGGLTRFDPPLPHVYIQALALDETRRRLYALCLAPEYLISWDMDTHETCILSLIGSGYGGMTQGENICLDDDGCCWTNWSLTRAWQGEPGPDMHRLAKYDPDTGEMVFFQKGLPRPDGGEGFARVESYFNLGTGCVYASAAGGALYRIDPATGDAEFLFRAVGDEGRGRRSRLAAMSLGPDGCAYGVTGRDGECEVLRFDPGDESYELLGPLVDDGSGDAAWQIHDVCVTPDGVLYAGENDNPRRSGYLWEVALGTPR